MVSVEVRERKRADNYSETLKILSSSGSDLTEKPEDIENPAPLFKPAGDTANLEEKIRSDLAKLRNAIKNRKKQNLDVGFYAVLYHFADRKYREGCMAENPEKKLELLIGAKTVIELLSEVLKNLDVRNRARALASLGYVYKDEIF